ncbi:HIF-1 transcription factor component sima isoform X1 [Bombus fervidus]|uniref:HIF-1 transcription factor component sima isoform X1 n=1 Tax=Bombus fervidus TaxID=203811 RepID=UPI003AB26A86
MIASRVQPIDTLADNEPGRCSDWIARQSDNASFYDDQSTLLSCQFACAQIQPPDDHHHPLNPCVDSSYNDQGKNPFESRSADVGTLAYQVSLPCMESSIPIEQLQPQLQSQCSQLRDCAQNIPPKGAKNCQLGPVDVEDLALCFESDKPQTNCSLRVYRPSSSSNFRRRVKATRYGPYPGSLTNDKQFEQPGFSSMDVSSSDLPCMDWLGGQFCGYFSQPFAFCTEERWLQCPESDRCPLYDTTYSYGQNVLPPCLYEDLPNKYYQYEYNEDEQLLEDYLCNEKRKEKSRDAARYRRSKETDIFSDLAAALPLPSEQASHLDKASVMRLAIAYLKVRSVVDSFPGTLTKSETLNHMDELFSRALNGFMLVLSNDGNMIYLSENVSDYLGVSQMDMMGQSVYEYSHPCDHDELRECLSSKPAEKSDKRACSFFLRLKCTLTSKGRKVNLKSASYKVIHCTGRLTYIRNPVSNSSETSDAEHESDDDGNERDTGASLVLLGCPIPHPSNIEIPLGRHTFLSKHSLSMKFTYTDEKLAEYLGWNSEELVGQSVFEFYHALDNLALDKCFKSLFSKGQCETVAYRFLGKRGGYAWVVTQATLIHCTKQQKPLSVVCVNYVLSGVEREDEVYSARQLAARDTKEAVKPEEKPAATSDVVQVPPLQATAKLRVRVQVNSKKLEDTALEKNQQQLSLPATKSKSATTGSSDRVKPLTVTSSIFRTADNKAKKEPVQLQDGSRKDNTFPRPVQSTEKSFVGVQALKESLEESLKENNEPKRKQRCRQQSAGSRTPFVFQGKPAVEYNSKTTVRQSRPHVVTRHLFASIATQQQQQQQQDQITCRPLPQTATASIFAPRTEDMNKGFLTFSEDHPGLTMLKDEPEDLTHLAPTPGDVCVPLEDTPFLTDMLDEFILGSDNYCPLLSPDGTLAPELRSTDFTDSLKDTELGDTSRSKDLGESLADSDPFMYGDSPSSPCSIDPSAVSPPLTKYRQSPERSIDSLGSPTGGSGADGLSEDEMLMLGLNDSIGDDELEFRAPYIPMSDQDEALDLLISNDMVMWSPPQTTDHKSCLKWTLTEKEQRTTDSSLAQLLKMDQVVSRKYNDHGGGLVNPVQVLGQIPRKNINLDNCHWSSKMDRPTKRIHTASVDAGNDNKRIRCDESAKYSGNLSLEDHLLTNQQPSSRKSSNLGNSQLLRRLVSQQNVLRNNFANESYDSAVKGRQNVTRLEGNLNAEDGEGDNGGGGGGVNDGGGRKVETNEGRCRRSGVENGDATSQISQRNPACNSVLMNLLVSGCDENLMDSRNVPSIYPKSLMSPLSVNLENHQMVPQCLDSRGSSVSFDQLSPAARKQLCSYGSIESSPSSPMMPFENFDYDTSMSANGLLQVEPDLFGSLLNRNLV